MECVRERVPPSVYERITYNLRAYMDDLVSRTDHATDYCARDRCAPNSWTQAPPCSRHFAQHECFYRVQRHIEINAFTRQTALWEMHSLK